MLERAAQLYRMLGDVRGDNESLLWVGIFHQFVRQDNGAAVSSLEPPTASRVKSTRRSQSTLDSRDQAAVLIDQFPGATLASGDVLLCLSDKTRQLRLDSVELGDGRGGVVIHGHRGK